MITLAKKIGQLRKEIEAKRGPFTLLALVLPEDAISWDLLASATWMDADQSAGLRYLVKEVQAVITKQELLALSGIVIFDSNKFSDEEGFIHSDIGKKETDLDVYGRHAEKAYIFVAPVQDFQMLVSQ